MVGDPAVPGTTATKGACGARAAQVLTLWRGGFLYEAEISLQGISAPKFVLCAVQQCQ